MGSKPFTEYQKEIAFDRYYAMGGARELKGLARGLVGAEGFEDRAPTWKTVKRWSADNNWQERAKLRDISNSKKEQDKTDKEVVNTKADYRKQIKERLGNINTDLGYLKTSFGTAKKKLEDEKNTELEVKSIKELVELAKAMQGMYKEEQNLMKLDLLMMGEADSHSEMSGNLAQEIIEGTYFKRS